MKRFNKSIFILFFACLFSGLMLNAQTNSTFEWTVKEERSRSFIENKGQFKLATETSPENSSVKFAYDGGSSTIYFTSTGISYSFLKRWNEKEKESEDPKERAREKAEERAREQREMLKGKSHAEVEAEEHRMKFKTDVVNMTWEGANPNAKLIALEPTVDYHVYVVKGKDGKEESINNIKAYKKLVYKNLYPNIDVEYIFHPQDGVKYTLVLHPGADVSKVKMKYSDAVHLTSSGEVRIQTEFGDIIDHAPLTFYSGNSSSVISSKFIRNGKTVSFELGAYDNTRSVTIDPWTQTPALPASNGVWECEKDAAGNAYIIGGDSPMKLLKYNAAGTLQWTYNTPWDTANYWLGTLATDNAGNSYVTAGSSAKLQKVSTAGAMLFSVSGGSVDEYWTISFNCDQTKLIVGGTRIQGLPSPTGAGMIFDINTSTGAVMATKKVGWTRTTTIFGFPVTDIEEVRSMTSSFNSRYYYLTLDTIGAIDQNFSACPGSNTLVGRNDGYAWGYKCENYRPDNGNAGVKAIRANQNFVYTHNGANVQKRSLTTGAVITTVAIPGGLSVASGGLNQAGCAGLDIDTCGNVYVGSTNAVIKYDANLVMLSSSPTSFRVYDIAVSSGGNIISCGTTGDNSNAARTGYVQQINMTACNAMTLICCNTNVCAAGPFCASNPPVTLTPGQTGGTWSGPGVNAATGVFNPATAGPGTHTITYTLACGSGSINIVVTPCTAPILTACQTTSGQITVSNGTPTYTWYHQVTTTPCVPGFGNCNGFGTVAGTPVTTWNSFATGSTVSPGTTYPIWVVDANGDSLQITSLASLPACTSCPALTITPASQINVNCFGQSTGSFSASTTGGVSPYDYTLMNGATTVATFNNIAGSQSFTGLAAGTYTLNVLDNGACPGSVSITITQPSNAASVSITGSTNASCGGNNGSATAAAAGGTSPYDYVWTGSSGTLQTTNNIAGSNTLTGLAVGTYTVTVTDNNNCTTTTTATITSTPGLTVSVTAQTNVLCFGSASGSATAAATGGASPYDYVWTGASGVIQTTPDISGSNTMNGLTAGSYTVTVTDNASCTSSTTVIITQPANAVTSSITASTDASCGASNGSATATAAGGSSPYDYVWTGSAGTLQTTNNITVSNTLSGLASGTYTVTVTDNNNCTTTTTVSIANTGGATVNITSITNVLCFGSSTGSVTAEAIGGTSPYDYVWTGSAGTLQTTNNIPGSNTLNGLSAGTYTVTVTDNAGCVSITNTTITEPSAATVSITASTNAACGSSNGSATATATGGSSPYDYVWMGSSGTLLTTNNVAGPNTINALAAGTYTVTITDNNNCTTSTTATITSTGGATVNITSQTNVLCFGASTGDATATASGGSSPYDYIWTGTAGTLLTTNNVTGSNTLSAISAGTYTVSVTDNNGCISTASATITEPASAASVAVTGTTNTPCGSSSGSATAQASGGTSPYDYVWTGSTGVLQTTNNITTANTLNGLSAGTYTITITDNNGCVSSATASVTSTSGASVSITAQTNNLCLGASTGTATAAATGGTSPYDYVWFSGSGNIQTTNNITGSDMVDSLAAGTYTVTVIDNAGCISNTSVTISEPATGPSVAITGTTNSSCGTATGNITAQAAGGSSPYDYVWSNGTGVVQTTNNVAGSDALNNIIAGTYTVSITDNNGCSSSITATVNNTGAGATGITSQTNVLCYGASTGSATVNTVGGSSPYDYVWTGSTGVFTFNNITTPSTLSSLVAGTYTVTVADNAGCISSVTINITQPFSALTLNPGSTTHTSCGLNNGSCSVVATGGAGGYSYNWLPSGGTGAIASPLSSGTYTVNVSDVNSCSSTLSMVVNSSTAVNASITSQTNVSCNGANDGTANVTPSGGSGSYTYSWSSLSATSANVTGLSPGTYTVTVTSGACVVNTNVAITQPAPILASISTVAATCSNSNGSASVSASGGTGALTSLWSNSATTSSITNVPSGSYSVVITDASGCTQTASAMVASTGSITASVSPGVTIIAGESTTLNATGGTTYFWTPSSGLSCSSCPSPVASPLQSTTYCVTADSATCTDTACLRINVEIPCPTNTDLAVPNAFSPNADGHNDIFCLQGWSNCIQTFTIYIFDRWGEKVFESDNPAFCWDGTYRGKALDPAVFVYFINATFTNAHKVNQKGNISLIR